MWTSMWLGCPPGAPVLPCLPGRISLEPLPTSPGLLGSSPLCARTCGCRRLCVGVWEPLRRAGRLIYLCVSLQHRPFALTPCEPQTVLSVVGCVLTCPPGLRRV